MMAMVRCNAPSVFVYGGSALPGRWRGRDVTALDSYEGVGAVMTGRMTREELDELERACRARGAQFVFDKDLAADPGALVPLYRIHKFISCTLALAFCACPVKLI